MLMTMDAKCSVPHKDLHLLGTTIQNSVFWETGTQDCALLLMSVSFALVGYEI
jgi:hypothetical protein